MLLMIDKLFSNTVELTEEQKVELREKIKQEKLAAKLIMKEELKQKWEEEKLKRKEGRDKVRCSIDKGIKNKGYAIFKKTGGGGLGGLDSLKWGGGG